MLTRSQPVFVALALAAISCSFLPIGASPATATPYLSPTPPSVPTHLFLSPTPAAPEAPTATPTPIPSQVGVIAFGSVRSGKMGLYTLTADGKFLQQLEFAGVPDQLTWPEVSPTGEQIVFVGVQGSSLLSIGLYVAKTDGSDVTQITEGDGKDPAWSPDGSLIAYTCNQNSDICMIKPDGSGQVNLTADSFASDSFPAWTPDGRIVFQSNRDLSSNGLFSELYIMDVGGTNVRRLTTDGTAYNVSPAVSPDGTQIAYESNIDVGQGSELYVMNLDGSNRTRVTIDDVWNQDPVWSPDGSLLLYAANDETGNLNLYQIGADGSNRLQLTQETSEDGGVRLGHSWINEPITLTNLSPEFQPPVLTQVPRGSAPVTNAILFATNSFNCSDCLETGIYSVGFDGANLNRLPVDGLYPAWSHSFARFAYIDGGDLYVANANGTQPTRVTHTYLNLSAPQWNIDDRTLAATCTPYGQFDVCLIDSETGAVSNITQEILFGTGIPFPYWISDVTLGLGANEIDDTGLITQSLPSPGRLSPNGNLLVAVENRQLVVMNPDGSNKVELTSDNTTKGFPVWSPDGSLIIYTVASGDGRLYLYAIRTNGAAPGYLLVPRPIAIGPSVRPASIDFYLGYNWSP